MPTETREFRVQFTQDELRLLAQEACHIPEEFIEANVTSAWNPTLGAPTALVIIFTIPVPASYQPT